MRSLYANTISLREQCLYSFCVTQATTCIGICATDINVFRSLHRSSILRCHFQTTPTCIKCTHWCFVQVRLLWRAIISNNGLCHYLILSLWETASSVGSRRKENKDTATLCTQSWRLRVSYYWLFLLKHLMWTLRPPVHGGIILKKNRYNLNKCSEISQILLEFLSALPTHSFLSKEFPKSASVWKNSTFFRYSTRIIE